MKKYLLIAIVALSTALSASAEKGDFSLGGQFVYASYNPMAGLGVQMQIEPITNWRIAPEFTYYLKIDDWSGLNANVNIHYVIPTSTSFAIYPLAGFSFGHFKYEEKGEKHFFDHDGPLYGAESQSYDRCGANVGMGAEYMLNEKLTFFSEERFQIMKDWNQSVTVLGLKYTF